MIGLLTSVAVIAAILLIVSATRALSSATSLFQNRRGTWGIARWTSTRIRPLNPHERRWQTALISAKDNPTRWPDLVTEIDQLHRLAGIAIDDPPDDHDHRWIESRLVTLEALVAETGDSDT